MTTPDSRSAQELAADRTDMAATRTLMAADRTLMAWIRTALSLISFGFTIFKVLQGFQKDGKALPTEQSPRNIGLFLAAMGTAAIVMGTIEYWRTIQEVRQFREVHVRRPSFIMALLMCGFGLFLFFGILMGVL